MKIAIKFKNGALFHIDAYIVANDRTEYFMAVVGITDRNSKEWEYEMHQSMKEIELSYWVQNKMKWSDIQPHAQLQTKQLEPLNYSEHYAYSCVELLTNPTA